jgi:REP element-mobilizing transposase RayT
MARKPRIYFAGAFYHVMIRGNHGEDIFFEDTDRKKFLSLLGECIIRFNCRVHAFCLMTNHVHLAIQVGETPLSKIIQNISFRYTQTMNKKRNKIGHLFQGRYKAILVDADNYLLQLVQYIHLNPVRAKIVKDPEKYLWSSHKAYLKLAHYEWLTTNYILGYFSDTEARALSFYKKFITCTSNNNSEINFDISNQKSFPAICDDAFMRKVETIKKKSVDKSMLLLEQIIQPICSFYQTEEVQLHTASRARNYAKIRAVIAWAAVEFKICTITKVASYFNREVSSLSRILNQIALSSNYHSELAKIREVINNANTQA